MMKSLKSGPKPLIRCTNHYSNPDKCQHNHYIYYDVLYAEVLERVQILAQRIESGELLKRIQKQASKKKKIDKLKTEQAKINKRQTVLKRIIKKLYEDFATELLDAENYHAMLTEYTKEQKELTTRYEAIEAELNSKSNEEEKVQKLKEVLDEYLHVETLTTDMLNQLIERIEIGHIQKVDGCRQQEITIVYRFIGTSDEL